MLAHLYVESTVQKHCPEALVLARCQCAELCHNCIHHNLYQGAATPQNCLLDQMVHNFLFHTRPCFYFNYIHDGHQEWNSLHTMGFPQGNTQAHLMTSFAMQLQNLVGHCVCAGMPHCTTAAQMGVLGIAASVEIAFTHHQPRVCMASEMLPSTSKCGAGAQTGGNRHPDRGSDLPAWERQKLPQLQPKTGHSTGVQREAKRYRDTDAERKWHAWHAAIKRQQDRQREVKACMASRVL